METQLQASLESALSEERQRTGDLEILKDHVAMYGYEVSTNVPYDGDCFFHSISHLLGKPVTNSEASTLRRELVLFFQSKNFLSFL